MTTPLYDPLTYENLMLGLIMRAGRGFVPPKKPTCQA